MKRTEGFQKGSERVRADRVHGAVPQPPCYRDEGDSERGGPARPLPLPWPSLVHANCSVVGIVIILTTNYGIK